MKKFVFLYSVFILVLATMHWPVGVIEIESISSDMSISYQYRTDVGSFLTTKLKHALMRNALDTTGVWIDDQIRLTQPAVARIEVVEFWPFM